MSIRFEHENGKTYTLREHRNGYHILIAVKQLDVVKELMKTTAVLTRMVPEKSSSGNVIRFDKVKEI